MWDGENHMVLDQYWDDPEADAQREAVEAARWDYADDEYNDMIDEEV